MISLLIIAFVFVLSLGVSAGIAFLCLQSAIWYTTRRP